MPLILKQETENQQAKLGVWEIIESLESLVLIANLSEEETIVFKAIRNENRAKQWLVSRIVLNQISENTKFSIVYEKSGRPLIDDGLHHISISHTSKFVAVILSRYLKVGIDIEGIHPRILKIRPKFVSPEEELFLLDDDESQKNLVLIWSAKEALFKMDGRGNMDFRKNISIKPFKLQQEGSFFGAITKNEISLDFALSYRLIHDHVLVYVTAPI